LIKFHSQAHWYSQQHSQQRRYRIAFQRSAIVLSLVSLMSGLSEIPVPAQPLDRVPAPVAQMPQSQAVVLGVVRSVDNADRWQDIVNRLDAAGVVYQTIDWQQVEQTTTFDNITVLFLPDVETITAEQVLALQNWLNRGGGVIISGPIGNRASAGVRRSLQSLFGAYWEADLEEPVQLQPVVRNSQPWLRDGDTESQVLGGSLIPTDLGSQSVATWNDPADGSATSATNTVAIVTTRQTVFLGWRWGHSATSSAAFDSRWLRAIVGRFEASPPIIAASPTPSTSSPFSSPPRSSASRPPASEPTDSVAARDRSPSPALTIPSRLAPNPPSRVETESAPPGLVVEPGNAPISLVKALSMRQELENLIGRFESALLAADSVNLELADSLQDGSQQAKTNPDRHLTASTEPALPAQETAETASHPILQTAQQKLRSFSDLVRQQNYAAARQAWLDARQLLWDNLPTDRVLAQTEIRAVWLDRETIVAARSRQGLAQIFDRLADAGINTVFFETINAGYPIYPSQVAPQQNPLIRNWDPLEAAVDLAHDRGMELHAWVWTFAAGNEAHNRLINVPLHYPGPILSERPQWASYDSQGNLILPGQEEAFLDPANPAARRYLLQLFEEIVTRYDVDGLQLDYIRYPFQNPNAGRSQGYGLAARQQFQQRWGVDPLTLTPGGTDRNRQLWQQWTEFRVEQINSFVAETSDLVHRLNPDLILSAAVFSMPTQERIQKIQQNWETWAQRGDVDMIVVMTYAADTNRLQQLATPWLLEETTDLGATIVLPGIRILNLSDAAVFDQIQALRDLPSGGYALFAMAHLQENLQGILNRTQGQTQIHSSERHIPYRTPFAAATDRFGALQREWNFLLSQNQLWMREPERSEWRSQVDALQQALAELSDDPSRQQLQQTQALLQAFQSQFGEWMRLQALTQPYRVRTWEHRLQTIANLLEYGDRVTLERWQN
jgi:uncharacterized lipoprotein YddW (UPF0748 family)